MEKCYLVNSENGYVIVGSKLVNVKLEATISKELENGIEVSLRCSHNGETFMVDPGDFYLTKDAFERSEHVVPQLVLIAGKIKGLAFSSDRSEIYSYVIGNDGIPYKKNFKIDYVEAYFVNGFCELNVPEIKEKLYYKKEWAIENTTYTEVCADGEEKTHIGLAKLLELTSEQKEMLKNINDLLQKLYDSGVKLERDNANDWYAFNTNRVKSTRIVCGWMEVSEWEERADEETVQYPMSLKVDMKLNCDYCEDNFCIRVTR